MHLYLSLFLCFIPSWLEGSLWQPSSTFLAPGIGFVEDNFSKDWGVGGMVQAVMRVMGSSRWSFACSPTAHLLLWGLVPNRLWTGTSPWPRGWGPLPYGIMLLLFKESFFNTKLKMTNSIFSCLKMCYFHVFFFFWKLYVILFQICLVFPRIHCGLFT